MYQCFPRAHTLSLKYILFSHNINIFPAQCWVFAAVYRMMRAAGNARLDSPAFNTAVK